MKQPTLRLFFMSSFLFLLILIFISSTTFGDTLSEPTRISGDNRYKTAIAVAEKLNNGKVQNVIISSGANFPDALSGSVLAVKKQAPILLVGNSVANSPDTINYITNNLDKTATIYILGGRGVISEEFEHKFHELGFTKIIRLGGSDRYESSALIANECATSVGTPVSIAFGGNFPDALALSTFSANKGWPILLSKTNELPPNIRQYLIDKKPTYVYIAGGTGVISENVANQIRQLIPNVAIERFAGQNRYETSSLINDYFAPYPTEVYYSSGLNFPDALTGSVLAGKYGHPIILIDPSSNQLPTSVQRYLLVKQRQPYKVNALGGTQVVPDVLLSNQIVSDKVRNQKYADGTLIENLTSDGMIDIRLNKKEHYSKYARIETRKVDLTQKDLSGDFVSAPNGGYAFYFIPIQDGKITGQVFLQYGPGHYEIIIREGTMDDNLNKYFGVISHRFIVESKDTRNMRLLAQGAYVFPTDPLIIFKAQEITQGLTSDLAKSKAIHDWVAKNLNYSYGRGNDDSDKVLVSRLSNHRGYATLTSALHRSAGIPVNTIRGYLDNSLGWDDTDGFNMWNEVLLNGRWVIVDTMLDSGYIEHKRIEDPYFWQGYYIERVFQAQFSTKYYDISREEFEKTHTPREFETYYNN